MSRLCCAGWECVKRQALRRLGRKDVVPGMAAGARLCVTRRQAHTHATPLHWHPHEHELVSCVGLTPDGEFRPLDEFGTEALLHACEQAVDGVFEQQGFVKLMWGMLPACPRSRWYAQKGIAGRLPAPQ